MPGKIIYAICGACGTGYTGKHHCAGRYTNSAQLAESEKPRVFYNPAHPDWGFKYPGRLDTPMPKYYREQGYVEHKFNNMNEHRKFTESQGLVNHKLEGIRDSALED